MILRGNLKVAQEEKKSENEILIYIFFEIKKLIVMLIMNSGIYLWEWVKVSIGNKGRYKHELERHKTEIESKEW